MISNQVLSAPVLIEDLYNHAPCGLLTLSNEGLIIHCNQTITEWLDTTCDELHDKPFTDLLDRGGKLYYQLFVQPILNMHNEVKEISLTIDTPAATFPCLFSARIQRFDDSTSTHLQITIFKVTNRRKYEEELHLKKVKAELGDKLKTQALADIAFNQSHLVRAPVANILGLTFIMSQMEMSKELKEVVTMIRESAEQLDHLVKSIVDRTDADNY